MISKHSFVKIMNTLRDYWAELSADMDRLGVVFEDNHLTRVFDRTMDALCEDLEENLDTEDLGPWCYYFAFELDWGRHEMAKDCVDVDGVKYTLQTPEQLYDLLMLLNDRENADDALDT